MVPQQNPYASPNEKSSPDQPRAYSPAELLRLLDEDDPRADSLQSRRRYIGHEAAIRTVGLVYCVSAWLMVVGLIGWMVQIVLSGRFDAITIVLALAVSGLTFLFFKLGYGLRELRAGPMQIVGMLAGLEVVAVIVFAALARNAIALGHLPYTVMVLYLIASPKSIIMSSERYKQVRQATPDVRYPAGPVLLTFAMFALSMLGPLFLAMALRPNDLPWNRSIPSANDGFEDRENQADGNQDNS